MNPINTILLQPTDVLFFRDGRPMEGSLAGHGAAWPLPNVTDAAFHAALHRSGLDGHAHNHRRDAESQGKDNRRFGSLVTAGPFPVHMGSAPAPGVGMGTPPIAQWFFPRPLDLLDDTLKPALAPTDAFDSVLSSLPDPLEYAVGNSLPPSKDAKAKAWLSTSAFQRYLDGGDTLASEEALDDSAFSDTEATIGIAIDAETGTTGQGEAAGKIYSARYLRLRDQWRLGVFAKTDEKSGSPDERTDLILDLIKQPHQLLVGGQQRICTAVRCETKRLPLPIGKTTGFNQHQHKWLVKWVLLSPAIWPEIPAQSKDGRPMTPHAGGWLPNWVRQTDGQVMLRSGKRQRRSYAGKHTRGYTEGATEVAAKLVAAIVPKPIPVTGWALANDAAPDRFEGGAKSTHLAVPAGAVYYFEADSAEHAAILAAALNWHSTTTGTEIKNRRSTLMGEKGFGLGVCGTWKFFGT
jgi:CRISPR/Cas system CMR-associated protein Cmr3 (group 5 of RAMP superfamily)